MDPDGSITFFNSEVSILSAVVVALFLLLGIAALMVWALIKAGNMRPPAALVTALSMLTLIAIIGGISTTNDEAWAIAAAGVGALAGSVTNVYQSSMDRMEKLISSQEDIAKTMEQAKEPLEALTSNGHVEQVEEPPEEPPAVWDEERK